MFGPVGLQTPKMKDDSSRLVCDFPSFLNVYLFSEVEYFQGALANLTAIERNRSSTTLINQK